MGNNYYCIRVNGIKQGGDSVSEIIIRGETFEENKIIQIDMHLETNVIAESLSIDTLDFTIASDGSVYEQWVPYDYDRFVDENGDVFMFKKTDATDLTKFQYGDVVEVIHKNGKIGKFYIETVERISSQRILHHCVSAVGLFDKLTDVGGMYNGDRFESAVRNIIGTTVTYTIDDAIIDLPIYGWLPYGTARDNLSQLLFSVGATMRTNALGELFFGFIDPSVTKEIETQNIFLGGSFSIETPATGVNVTEHEFTALADDKIYTLFDNNATGEYADNQLVIFPNPYHNLVPTNLVVHESGVNYAIISGVGKLVGKEYTHQTKVISKTLIGQPSEENIIRINDATLVNVLNSDGVAERVLDYKSKVKKSRVSFVMNDEKPTDLVVYDDDFSEPQDGVIGSMNVTFGGFMRAESDVLVGFTLPEKPDQYKNRLLITQNQTWTVPVDVTKCRITLIGGGYSGRAGTDGEHGGYGNKTRTVGFGKNGSSGLAGGGGSGGKIVSKSEIVTAGQTIDFTIGNGGITGSNPTATISSTGLSSDVGVPSATGYKDIMTGEFYAKNGKSGLNGGEASEIFAITEIGDNDYELETDYKYINVYASGDVGNFGYRWEGESGDLYTAFAVASGGTGGGAAFGANGENGEDGMVTSGSSGYVVSTGKGGDGGNASKGSDAPYNAYGQGGNGGHGGGGGGGGGNGDSTHSNDTLIIRNGGYGGKGSDGGNGANGCVIIYY